MTQAFQRIVLFGRPRSNIKAFTETLETLANFLTSRSVDIIIEDETAAAANITSIPTLALADLNDEWDLVIVVGGDGSLLSAARTAARANVPVTGINRGRLGFLTDIIPAEVEEKIAEILAGKYFEEPRFLLEAKMNDEANTRLGDALNDVVLLPGNTAHMIEFEISINNELVSRQRADGLIIATPTGSTAYALSGGGPIVHPRLDAVVLVPMFPHKLSSRPIVIDANSQITLTIGSDNDTSPQVSCDGGESIVVNPGNSFHICKKKDKLRLLHPCDYNYYETLRSKLSWESSHWG